MRMLNSKFDMNTEALKMAALWLGEIDKFEYLIGK